MSVRKNVNFAISFPVLIFIYVIKWNSLPEWFFKVLLGSINGFLSLTAMYRTGFEETQ